MGCKELKRRFYANTNVQARKQLYVSYVRPHLEYECQVWDPHLKKDIEALESIQKFAMRVCTRQWDTPYQTLLNQLNLPSLADRRRHLKLCTAFKVIHGLVDFPNSPFWGRQNANPYKLRHLNTYMYTMSSFDARTNGYLHSFFPFVAALWNTLPSELLHRPYLNFIKHL